MYVSVYVHMQRLMHEMKDGWIMFAGCWRNEVCRYWVVIHRNASPSPFLKYSFTSVFTCVLFSLFQSVTIVLYDKGIARQFREKARQIIDPPLPAFLADPQPAAGSSSDSDDDGDNGSNDDGGVLMDPFASPHGFGDFFTRPIVDDDDDDDKDGNDDSDDNGLSFFNLDEDEDAVDRGVYHL